MLRIIAGYAKGIKLKVVNNIKNLRPTQDRIKESLFASIGDLSEKNIVDLYSGSGNLGLEALSRGAKNVFLIEKDRKAIAGIQENIKLVKKAIFSIANNFSKTQNIEAFCADVLRTPQILNKLAGNIDFIFADPPYDFLEQKFDLLYNEKFAHWAKNALFLLETGHSSLDFSDKCILWKPINIKYYGTTTIYFLKAINNSTQ